MVTIPRLPPANNPIDVTITVGVKLRPYFTEWYQAEKLNGEAPEQFTLRMMKGLSAQWYIERELRTINTDLNTDQINLF